MTGGVTDYETERLRRLKELEILDSKKEHIFDSVTNGVARVLDVPIVLISLVDESRQWFKSRVGLDVQETSRSHAFCRYALEGKDPLIVNDALDDERFKFNPLVTGDPRIRFYAGAPIIVDGEYTLGTLCAIDTKPRSISDREIVILQSFASVVSNAIKLRKTLIDELRDDNEP